MEKTRKISRKDKNKRQIERKESILVATFVCLCKGYLIFIMQYVTHK